MDQGFTMVKQRFGYGPRQGVAGMRRNVELVRTVREVVGPDVELAADAYMGWDVRYAIRMVRMLEDEGLDLAWVEEPLMPDDYDGYAALRAAVRHAHLAAASTSSRATASRSSSSGAAWTSSSRT